MGQLLFKKCFWESIRAGTKRTTIRRWSSARLKAGQRAFSPGVGWLIVEQVERIDDLARLGDADAHADGFETSDQMREALLAFYPSQGSDGRGWFRVSFRCDGEAATSPSRRLRRAASAASDSSAPAPAARAVARRAKPKANSKSKGSSKHRAVKRSTKGVGAKTSLRRRRGTRD